MRCLVTGATGYIGGRLVPRLLEAGHQVRCLSRSPGKLRDVPWAADVEITSGDLAEPPTLEGAFDGIDVAYYLVHSLGTAGFEAADRAAAQAFADAAARGRRTPDRLPGRSRSPTPGETARRRTCARAPRWAGSCSSPGCPPRSCGRR